jgi:GST-like protein
VKRQLDVLDRRFAESEYVAGPDYTIADMAIWPWYGGLAKGRVYGAAEFLDVDSYKNLQRWMALVEQRPAVQRGLRVNSSWGDTGVPERHEASDLDPK